MLHLFCGTAPKIFLLHIYVSFFCNTFASSQKKKFHANIYEIFGTSFCAVLSLNPFHLVYIYACVFLARVCDITPKAFFIQIRVHYDNVHFAKSIQKNHFLKVYSVRTIWCVFSVAPRQKTILLHIYTSFFSFGACASSLNKRFTPTNTKYLILLLAVSSQTLRNLYIYMHAFLVARDCGAKPKAYFNTNTRVLF